MQGHFKASPTLQNVMQSTRVGSVVSLDKQTPGLEPVASLHCLQQKQRRSLQQHRQRVEQSSVAASLSELRGIALSTFASTASIWSAMLWLTVSKHARAWNDQSDHSVSVPVNRGGLPSRRTSTSIPPRIDPAACHAHHFVQHAPHSTYQKRNSSTPGWVFHVVDTKLSGNESMRGLSVKNDLRLTAPASPHDVCNVHA